MSRRSGLDWILTEGAFREMIEPLVSEAGSQVRGVVNVDSIESEEPQASVTHEFAASEPLLLQHSSGTTGLQKAVVLSHDAVMRHLRYYGEAIGLTGEDRIASWLPLYHDMGLIAAFHLPLYHGITSIQLDPFEWVMAPVLLLQAMAEERATVTWLPNFAYNLIAERIHDDEIDELDLSHVRLMINCSEPVRASSHRALFAKLERTGLKASALSACYAMAETTFAITQTEIGTAPTTVLVDREALRDGVVRSPSPSSDPRAVRECVSSGTLIQGCQMKVVDDTGSPLGDGMVGELIVSSESMFDGYRNWPEKTAESLSDGWFKTGDLGFRWNGEFFVSGRKKDLIIVAGKNIYPEDLEDVVSAVDGVIPGRVVACGLDDAATGTEKICVIAESEAERAGHAALVSAIKAAVARLDVTATDVFVVPPRWLIKSSAGKPSRRSNKERIEAMFADGGSTSDL
jgi:acyl-CoA synthetase (AMP-forming)/AMP-acid ligase II